MLVSIIVPCYMQGQYLAETLKSVENQTFTNWECIIVNDGSTDSTQQESEKFTKKDSRFKYIYQNNAGLANARNAGIKYSKGDLILPLDSDDLIGPEYLQKAVTYFECHPECTLVYCRAKFFGTIDREWILEKYSYDRILWQNCIFCSSIFKRVDYDKTCGYNPNMIYGWEDWDFWISLLDVDSHVYQIDQILFFYRQKQESMITNANRNSDYLYSQIMKNHPDKYIQISTNSLKYYAELHYLQDDLTKFKESNTFKIVEAIVDKRNKIKSFIGNIFRWKNH